MAALLVGRNPETRYPSLLRQNLNWQDKSWMRNHVCSRKHPASDAIFVAPKKPCPTAEQHHCGWSLSGTRIQVSRVRSLCIKLSRWSMWVLRFCFGVKDKPIGPRSSKGIWLPSVQMQNYPWKRYGRGCSQSWNIDPERIWVNFSGSTECSENCPENVLANSFSKFLPQISWPCFSRVSGRPSPPKKSLSQLSAFLSIFHFWTNFFQADFLRTWEITTWPTNQR